MMDSSDRITKRVYRVVPKPRFQLLRADVPETRLRSIGFTPAGSAWSAPPALIDNPQDARADFVYSAEFGLACPLSLVREHPESGIERDCEIYPFRIADESEEYVIIRPKRVLSEEEVFEKSAGNEIRKVRDSAVASSFLFLTAAWSKEIHAAIVEGPGQPVDNFLRFSRIYTGLDLQLVGEAR